MTVTARLNSIRAREDAADARKTAAIIAVLSAFCGFAFIVTLLLLHSSN